MPGPAVFRTVPEPDLKPYAVWRPPYQFRANCLWRQPLRVQLLHVRAIFADTVHVNEWQRALFRLNIPLKGIEREPSPVRRSNDGRRQMGCQDSGCAGHGL